MTAAISIAFAVASTLISSVGLILFKKATRAKSLEILRDKNFLMGGACFLIGGVLLISAMRYSDLSEVFPITSLTYIWVMALSSLFLGEKLNRTKATTVILIVLGIMLVAQ